MVKIILEIGYLTASPSSGAIQGTLSFQGFFKAEADLKAGDSQIWIVALPRNNSGLHLADSPICLFLVKFRHLLCHHERDNKHPESDRTQRQRHIARRIDIEMTKVKDASSHKTYHSNRQKNFR